MAKEKNFYACKILNEELEKARGRSKACSLSLPDMFHILLYNQTILNEKLNELLINQKYD